MVGWMAEVVEVGRTCGKMEEDVVRLREWDDGAEVVCWPAAG